MVGAAGAVECARGVRVDIGRSGSSSGHGMSS